MCSCLCILKSKSFIYRIHDILGWQYLYWRERLFRWRRECSCTNISPWFFSGQLFRKEFAFSGIKSSLLQLWDTDTNLATSLWKWWLAGWVILLAGLWPDFAQDCPLKQEYSCENSCVTDTEAVLLTQLIFFILFSTMDIFTFLQWWAIFPWLT